MITSGRRRPRLFGRRLMRLSLRVDFSLLDITGGALGSASGSVNNFVAERCVEKRSADGVRHLVRIESYLWCYGQKSLTTRRFTRKVNTHFYHARPATCPVRPYKQRAGHSPIPDGNSTPRSLLAPYDDSTS